MNRYPVWVFRVSIGPPESETVVAYGELNDRTLTSTSWGPSEQDVPRAFRKETRERLRAKLFPESALTDKEVAERVDNLRGIIPEEEIRDDIEFWPNGSTPVYAALRHLAIERGWIGADEKDCIILIFKTNPLSSYLYFRVNLQFYPHTSGKDGWERGFEGDISASGEIDACTLEILPHPIE